MKSTSPESPKRQRLEGDADISGEAIAEARNVRESLEAVYANKPEEELWDTSKFQKLVQPTACYTHDSAREYMYIGRARAKDLLAELLSLEAGAMLQIEGAKGSGKSTAVSCLVGFMLAKLKRKVVYICASHFIANPVGVLRHALLVATECDERVSRVTGMDQLDNWCSARRRDTLMFVVDDWDKFEDFPDKQSALEGVISYYHILVKLSSTNSRERRILAASDKPPRTFGFDGPYTPEELNTWITQSSLPEAKLEAVDYLTGGMPRLLRIYEEVGGNERLFRERIDVPYTSKLFDKLIALQTTKEQLGSAVQMVTTGVRGIHLKQPVDLTCFYQTKNKFKLVSPYFRSRAEYYIMEQQKALQSSLNYEDVLNWAGAVRMDCIVKGRNPARSGWNVEGLVVAVMRYQGKLWDGLPFLHYSTYEHGCEAALLGVLTTIQLSKGVLVGPVAFNEKAVDVMYLKLDQETRILTVKAVQITISKWKNKRRKRSHKVWQEEVLPRWLAQNWTIEHQFIHVMPEYVRKEDLGEIQEDLCSYVAACHASRSEEDVSEDRDEDDGSEEYEGVDLGQVQAKSVEFKKLGEVHECLAEFDRLLNLGEPAKLKKMGVKHCSGKVTGKWHEAVPHG